MSNIENQLIEQIDDLYAMHETDVELFSVVTEDGSLHIDEQNLLLYRLMRVHALYEHFEDVLRKHEPTRMIKFIDILLTWIIERMNNLGDSELEELEKGGLVALTQKAKKRFDEITGMND